LRFHTLGCRDCEQEQQFQRELKGRLKAHPNSATASRPLRRPIVAATAAATIAIAWIIVPTIRAEASLSQMKAAMSRTRTAHVLFYESDPDVVTATPRFEMWHQGGTFVFRDHRLPKPGKTPTSIPFPIDDRDHTPMPRDLFSGILAALGAPASDRVRISMPSPSETTKGEVDHLLLTIGEGSTPVGAPNQIHFETDARSRLPRAAKIVREGPDGTARVVGWARFAFDVPMPRGLMKAPTE